jgi:hypothetical protein
MQAFHKIHETQGFKESRAPTSQRNEVIDGSLSLSALHCCSALSPSPSPSPSLYLSPSLSLSSSLSLSLPLFLSLSLSLSLARALSLSLVQRSHRPTIQGKPLDDMQMPPINRHGKVKKCLMSKEVCEQFFELQARYMCGYIKALSVLSLFWVLVCLSLP